MKSLLLLAALAACSTHATEADPKPAPTPAPTPPIPYGRWTSPSHCLVLLENGDFELVDKQFAAHGKTLVYGTAKQIPNDDGMHFDLAVAKIWQARWVSNCRKHVASAKYLDDYTTAGITWKPGLHQKVRIAANDGGQELDVCIEKECLTLHKDDEAPLVDANWVVPDAAAGKLAADVPLRLDINAQSTDLQFRPAKADTSWPSAYATTTKLDVLGHDRFRLVVTPTFNADDAKLAIWGTPIAKDVPITLALHRLAGERLEACLGKQCATYERRFDNDSYDVR